MNEKVSVQTVLLVDDDPEALAAGCIAIGARYPVLTASSGEEALRVARKTKPTVIVLDVMMPGGKNGFTVFHELKEDPDTRDIPVIFLTSVNRSTHLAFGPDELERQLGCRPAAFIEKPISSDELVHVVAGVIGDHGGCLVR